MTLRFPLLTAALLAAALALGAIVPLHAHEAHEHFSAGEPGDPKKPFRVVQVTMHDDNGAMAFEPSKLEVNAASRSSSSSSTRACWRTNSCWRTRRTISSMRR